MREIFGLEKERQFLLPSPKKLLWFSNFEQWSSQFYFANPSLHGQGTPTRTQIANKIIFDGDLIKRDPDMKVIIFLISYKT